MMNTRTKFAQTTLGERKTSEYGTPLSFFHTLNAIFKFKMDPCALESDPSRLGLDYNITKNDHGLQWNWDRNAFINPPFGTKKGEKVGDWIRKMQHESNKYPDNVYVMLLPTRLESNWFQDLIWEDKISDVYIVRGRLKFYNPETNKNDDPHPIGSMLVIRSWLDYKDMATQYSLLEKNIPGIWVLRDE